MVVLNGRESEVMTLVFDVKYGRGIAFSNVVTTVLLISTILYFDVR